MPYPKIALKYAKKASAARRIQRKFRSYRKKKTNFVKRTLYKLEPTKYNSFPMSQSLPSTGWTLINNITNIGYDPEAATNSGDRKSTKIKVNMACLRASLTVGTGDGLNVVRIALVRGRRSGALQLSDVAYGGASVLDAQFNQKFVDVIWDKTYKLQEQAPGSTYPKLIYLDIPSKINKLCKFEEQSAAGIVQPYNNTSYYLIGCSDSALTPHPSIRGTCRVSFKDLD